MPDKAKALSTLLAGALYAAIIFAAVLVAMTSGVPAILKLQDIAASAEARNSIIALDSAIQEITSEGPQASKYVTMQIKKGSIHINPENGTIYYLLNTKADIAGPPKKQNSAGISYEYSNTTSTLKISKNYSNGDISITGRIDAYAGAYRFLVKNMGDADGKAIIEITKQ